MDLPVTRGIVPRLDVVAATGSTNADLAALVRAGGVPPWTVLVTDDQTAGRGRLDRSWSAPAGSALAVSVAVPLTGLERAVGWIPLAAGLALRDALAPLLPGREVGVKWPNDVLVAAAGEPDAPGRKVCGVLAELVDATIVLGAGINTTMTAAQLPVPTATSIAVEGGDPDADAVLSGYLLRLRSHLDALADAGGDATASGLRAAVTAACVTLGRELDVHLPDGGRLPGRATGLDGDGRLVVAGPDGERAVTAGDVVHVR